jgi:hypothetical protein
LAAFVYRTDGIRGCFHTKLRTMRKGECWSWIVAVVTKILVLMPVFQYRWQASWI